MGGSSGQTPATSTQTSEPWSGAQGYLLSMYGQAQNLRDADVGYQPYTGATQAPIDPYLTEALHEQAVQISPEAAGTRGSMLPGRLVPSRSPIRA